MPHRWLVTATCAAVLTALPLTVQAQDTCIDMYSTVNTALPGHLYIGQNTTAPITVDLVPGGSVVDNTAVRNNARLNIQGQQAQAEHYPDKASPRPRSGKNGVVTASEAKTGWYNQGFPQCLKARADYPEDRLRGLNAEVRVYMGNMEL